MNKWVKISLIVISIFIIISTIWIYSKVSKTCDEVGGECKVEEECPINQLRPTFTNKPFCTDKKVCCYKFG